MALVMLPLVFCSCARKPRASKEQTSVSPVHPAAGKVIDQKAVYPEQPKVTMKEATDE